MIRAFTLLSVLASLATASCAEAAPPEQAPAPRISRIVAFGDSFADDGNIYELFGTSPPPLYPRGRFSDGTNFVDTMGELLRVPVANFALGGAFTGAGQQQPAGRVRPAISRLPRGGRAFLVPTRHRQDVAQ